MTGWQWVGVVMLVPVVLLCLYSWTLQIYDNWEFVKEIILPVVALIAAAAYLFFALSLVVGVLP